MAANEYILSTYRSVKGPDSGLTRVSDQAPLPVAPGVAELDPFPAAAYTGTQTSADLVNLGGRGCVVTFDLTVLGSTTVTVAVKYKDGASGKYVTLLTSAAYNSTGTKRLTIYPTLTAAANVTAQDVLPRVFQVVVTPSDGVANTYSLSVNIIP